MPTLLNKDATSVQPVAIQIHNLTKRFGHLTAVDHITFDIYKNEVFGLLGPNGAGKTTSINMICGLMPSSDGSIRFIGCDDNRDHKLLIGYCPQDNIFYPKLTCLEQLIFIGQMYGMAVKTSKLRARQLLEQLGLKEKTDEKAVSLSGGMKRRLNICLALVHDPEILILDEPEAGLDPQSRILVRDFIKAFGKKKTVILTTHNMDEADRLADRVAIIDYGKLLLLDAPGNLKRTVGEGDVLEIVFENGTDNRINDFALEAAAFSVVVSKSPYSILFKNPGTIEHLPRLRQMAATFGLSVAEIKLRENTLEDVFIHLTGRNLRQ